MARYVLPVVGAVVGFIYGGPAGASLGWSLGAAVGGLVDPQVIKGPSVGDLAQQTSQEGVPRPIVFGQSQPFSGNVIVSGEPRVVKRKKSGKGGPKVETETVYRTYAIRICEADTPTTILRVWKNNQLVYDARPGHVTTENNLEFTKVARFFLGGYTQNPSPDLEALFGVGTTPAHRGTCYMVMADDDLTDMRGAIPQFQFQVGFGAEVPVGSVDMDAIANCTDTIANGGAVGFEFDGFEPDDSIIIRRNPAGTYVAWSPWGVPALSGPLTGSTLRFNILRGSTAGGYLNVEDAGVPHDGYAAAAAYFDAQYPEGLVLTGYTSYVFFILDTLILDNTGGVSLYMTKRGANGVVLLRDLIAAICERAGLEPSMYDVSEIDPTQEVNGLTLVNTYPAYTALQALSAIFFFAPSYYDGVVHFVPGGGNSVATITEADMIDDDADIEETERDDSIAVARVMHLLYYDVEGGLATDKQTSERAGDRRAQGEQSMSSAVVMRSTQAARAVAVNHKVSIEELRGSVKFSLPDSWLGLVPASVVIVQWNGQSHRMRITKVEVFDGYQQYEMYHDRQSSYTSEVEGIPAAPQTPPPSNVIGPTLIEALDIHILRDADDAAGLLFYIAISGTEPAWNGAEVEVSMDGGLNYINSVTSTVDVPMGQLTAVLGNHPQAFPDFVNTLAVEVFTPYAEFDPADMTGLLNQQNLAIVGDEIIQFGDADEVTEDNWEFRTLLRGRKGTTPQEHAIGTRFVLLERSALGTVPASVADVGRTWTFRATSFGETEDTATIISMTYTGRSQIEREPAYLQARLDGTDAIVSWQGVGRLGSGAQVAHGVRFTGYRVTFEGAGIGETPITTDTTAETITQDVSSLTQPIRVSVVQLNELMGEGPELALYI